MLWFIIVSLWQRDVIHTVSLERDGLSKALVLIPDLIQYMLYMRTVVVPMCVCVCMYVCVCVKVHAYVYESFCV